MNLPWQAVGDCGWCKVEGATVELIDPSHPSFQYGHAVLCSCNLCGYEETWGDDLTMGQCHACAAPLTTESREQHRCLECDDAPAPRITNGIDLRDSARVREAIDTWATREGLTADELVSGSFGLSVEGLLVELAAGEPVESSLHAIAFLFPGMAAGGSASEAVDVAAPEEPITTEAPPIDVLAPSRLLVSVMLADGCIVNGETAFIEAWLHRHALPPLQPEDLRPWRPHEVGPIQDRGVALAALEAAVELMHLDGIGDGSEMRIIRTFARVWGISEEPIQKWNRTYERRYAPPLSTVWQMLSRWVS